MRFESVRAGYGGVERLHGVTCEARAGRLTALIGPNGCGKSTLLKCASGFSALRRRGLCGGTGGVALAAGAGGAGGIHAAVAADAGADRRQLVAHGRYPHLRWGRSLTRADREVVRAAMARTGALAHADRSVAELSGGERQRVYLAMMLAQQAPELLLDEPTAYLDPGAQFRLMELLASLRDEGRAVIAVLHDLALAMTYADDVLLMREGRLVCAAPPEALTRSVARSVSVPWVAVKV